MLEVSRRVATSFGRVGVVASLACTVSGLEFALLTGCGDGVVDTHNNPPHDDGGSVTNPDSTVTNPNGTITHPDGAVQDGTPVDSAATAPDGGSSSTAPDAGSDGPLNPTPGGSCATVPVP